jgi:hypothetical protein
LEYRAGNFREFSRKIFTVCVCAWTVHAAWLRFG